MGDFLSTSSLILCGCMCLTLVGVLAVLAWVLSQGAAYSDDD